MGIQCTGGSEQGISPALRDFPFAHAHSAEEFRVGAHEKWGVPRVPQATGDECACPS